MPALTILIACDVLATAMIAGFLTMYCLTIGGYFTFMALLLVVHALTGFTGPEEKLVSGQDLTDAELARYLRLNLPLHVIYACVYAASALAALAAALA